MKKTIIINGKTYEIPEIDFNTVCELESFGFSIFDFKSKGLSSIRALVAFALKTDLSSAGKEVEEHLKNKGKMDDFEPLVKAVKDSDFFRHLS